MTEAKAEALAGGETAAQVTIDLGALVGNWRAMRDRSRPARASAVVKADAYGIGIEAAVPALARAGCREFFVALPAEAVAARRVAPDASIFVLNGLLRDSAETLCTHDLVPVLGSAGDIARWTAEAGARPYALHVDTGMNRFGLSPHEAFAFAAATRSGAAARPGLVMSHLACGDDPANPMNADQAQGFREIARAFDGVEASLANSAGIFLGQAYGFDLTRPGIALYGGEAVAGQANPMTPVVRLKAPIVALRSVKAGATVSYAASQRLARDSLIATASIGYADGYPRSLSGAGIPLRGSVAGPAEAVAAGCRVPLIGRVTMDMTMFDVTDLPAGALAVGDVIELFGPAMPIDDVARKAGTIGYELLTGLSRRAGRRVIAA